MRYIQHASDQLPVNQHDQSQTLRHVIECPVSHTHSLAILGTTLLISPRLDRPFGCNLINKNTLVNSVAVNPSIRLISALGYDSRPVICPPLALRYRRFRFRFLFLPVLVGSGILGSQRDTRDAIDQCSQGACFDLGPFSSASVTVFYVSVLV